MIRLHHCHQSRSMRSLWVLEELGVPFELVVHRFDKSLRDESYLALNPAGRVPALEIDGTVMFETGAITQVLCERYEGLNGAEGERSDWLVWVHFAETISQHVAALTQQHIMLYDDAMRSPIVMKLEAARIGKCLDAVERRLAVSGAYLLESGFSAADISVGQAIYMARHFVEIEGWEKVSAWVARITKRPAFERCLPPEGAALLYPKAFYPVWEVPK